MTAEIQRGITMKYRFYASFLTLVLAGVPTFTLADEGEAAAMSSDGMQLVEKDRRGEIYADPGVDWTVYSKIMLDDATVAFRKNWERDQNRNRTLSNRVTAKDMERIKTEMAELFDEVFVHELSEKGTYVIVEEAADDVLRITPHIVDLDVYAPEVNSASYTRSFTRSSGQMTLKLELYDSATGDLIAVASDRRESPDRGFAQWTTSATNKGDARRMLQQWAEGLHMRLNEATGKNM